MSAIHQCKNGGTDFTGRGTPGKVPCKDRGGLLFPLTPGEIVAIDDYGDCPSGVSVNENDPCVLKLQGRFVEMVPGAQYLPDRVKVEIDDYKGQGIVGSYTQMDIKKSLGMTPPPEPPVDVTGCMDPIALNYNPDATAQPDVEGICQYDEDEVVAILEEEEETITAGVGGENKTMWYIIGGIAILGIGHFLMKK